MSMATQVSVPWQRIIQSVFAGSILLMLYIIPLNLSARWILFIVAAIVGSYQFARNSVRHVFKLHKITTDVIMMLAIIGAAILGELEESLTIVFLYSITETLESYTVRRTKYSISSLINLVPREVTKLVDEKEVTIPISSIARGDLIRVRVGDVLPTDGVIQYGSAAINESTITGEPIPVYKSISDKVLAGTSCEDGTFVFEVTQLPSESTVNKIIRLVEEAQSKKIPVQLTIERFTKYYNPGILVFAFLVFLIPAIVTANYTDWAILGVTLLVASAPCAIVISAPVSMYAAISSSASRGILVKGGVFLEELGRTEAVIFDKTGTLTSGKPELTDIIALGNKNETELLQLAGSMESLSNHPIAKAITSAFQKENLKRLEIENHATQPGIGISATIEGISYFIGTLSDDEISSEISSKVASLKQKGKTISYLQASDTIIGAFGIADRIRSSAVNAIQDLKTQGIEVFMLTGDGKEAAEAIASQLDIAGSNVFHSMSPEEKMQKVEELQKQYKLVMVGDGINDAPALALADIGVAMGVAGTDVALETADIAIMSEELPQLVESMRIGKTMKSTMIQNILISTLILFGTLLGVFLGIFNITQAILIHEGTEVLIVANAMKLFLRS